MDVKQGALYTILVLGGIGLLAVSCSDKEPTGHVATQESHKGSGHGAKDGHAAHWSYAGEGAPSFWGELKAEYELCAAGMSQSPIDISTVTITNLPDIEFNYQASPLEIVNNGHTIQVNYAPGSSITVADKQYELLQFHFHSPSEHTVGGRAYDMVAHLVHKADDGQLGVVGLMFRAGELNNHIAQLWSHMPKNAGAVSEVDDVMINASDLLPKNLTYFNYSGSLTTPPCSEGVNWMVLTTAVNVAPEQIKQFTDVFPLSTRPVQPPNGRSVKVGND